MSTSNVISFLEASARLRCVSCERLFHENPPSQRSCSGAFDLPGRVISFPKHSFRAEHSFSLITDFVPADMSGAICDLCIKSMLDAGQIEILDDPHPLYQSFTYHDGSTQQLAAICHNLKQFSQFVADAKVFYEAEFSSTSSTIGEGDYPFLVISHGLDPETYQLRISILRQFAPHF